MLPIIVGIRDSAVQLLDARGVTENGP
jgi:hypothetical protein